jgi:cell division septation protein DedD
MRTADGVSVRCGPQEALPYTLAPTQSPAVTSRAKTPSFGDIFQQTEVPASNPTVATDTQITRPAGYENVWNDGRLNPNRGLPKPQAAAPRAKASGHSFVQVGTFGDHGNAARLGQQLAGLGLPAHVLNRGQMKMVVTGPFSDASALRNALATVRNLGFSDAYTRN